MYLKSLVLQGFKSFAHRTQLDFERGMTVVVGPNGCGKSNISDAVRWVLGEQSAKALRGSKMEDCIFNGTDKHKALGMAEVSLTFTDCENVLGTEYNEVTITRRVLRSGEGQYFLNKQPCRLKDLQRLFMDTGVGTNSYSLMEQGRIDQILSSRPEDRRAVFEEASGITKYKNDKKEATRKLEHTEANLLRLEDIIREVKRQIISLQRQAGKARRYKELRDRLRSLDLYLTRQKLIEFDKEESKLQNQVSSLNEQTEAVRDDIEETEQTLSSLRNNLSDIEEEIASSMEGHVSAKTELEHVHNLIRINEDRVDEFKHLTDRDSRDANEARRRLEDHRVSLRDLEQQITSAVHQMETRQRELTAGNQTLEDHEIKVNEARYLVNQLRNDSIDLESRLTHLQNELSDLDSRERSSVFQRERLGAEQTNMKRSANVLESKKSAMNERLQTLGEDVTRQRDEVENLSRQWTDLEETFRGMQAEHTELTNHLAAKEAQIDLLGKDMGGDDGFPSGATYLLREKAGERDRFLGALADHVSTEPEYQRALEAVCRAWADTILVKDEEVLKIYLDDLVNHDKGSARLLAATPAGKPAPSQDRGKGIPLHTVVHASDVASKAIEQLLMNVYVVDDVLAEPLPPDSNHILVSRNGVLRNQNNVVEWWNPQTSDQNPIRRRHTLSGWKSERDELLERKKGLEQRIQDLENTASDKKQEWDQSRKLLEEIHRQQALLEGEHQVITQETREAIDRFDTVSFELNALTEQGDTTGKQRESLLEESQKLHEARVENRKLISENSEELGKLEERTTPLGQEATEKRIAFAEQRQEVGHLDTQQKTLQSRIQEIQQLIQERSQGLSNYKSRINQINDAIKDTHDRISPLGEKVASCDERINRARQSRVEITSSLHERETGLREKRVLHDELRDRKSGLDLELAEHRMRKENLIERVTGEHNLPADQIAEEPEPEWQDDQARDNESLESLIAEIRAKLESMGPVNLVAIEEHEELQKRYDFLTQQQDDLLKAKDQLLEMIKKINNLTTEMFSATFNQVNDNFQKTFKTLFGGGNAKLVMVDEEDVLASGIEIIARPPGKKLQTVSLLSGGERTLTAVALLFALYMVKPSAFCLLDELDASLDDANIGRFITLLKGFVEKTQFIIITHNRQTIGEANILYGVTMEERGVSKIVSVKFSGQEEDQPILDQNVPAS